MNMADWRVEDCPELPRCADDEWCWYRWTRALQRQADPMGTIELFIAYALIGYARATNQGGHGEWYEMANAVHTALWSRGYRSWYDWPPK